MHQTQPCVLLAVCNWASTDTFSPPLPPLALLLCSGIEQLPEEDVFLLDDSPQPHMSKPGCYRGVCVALKLHHLAVAAVDTAPQLAELSGALTLEGLLGPAAPTFKVLRDLVQVSLNHAGGSTQHTGTGASHWLSSCASLSASISLACSSL
jgi:hypothetical protein